MELEKAIDRLPHAAIEYALRARKAPEGYVQLVMDTYRNSRKLVQTSVGPTDDFPARVGVHQGSCLSPLIFVTVLDVISQGIGGSAPWTMQRADDLMIAA